MQELKPDAAPNVALQEEPEVTERGGQGVSWFVLNKPRDKEGEKMLRSVPWTGVHSTTVFLSVGRVQEVFPRHIPRAIICMNEKSAAHPA